MMIVEPRENIDKVWGKQRIREADTYRLMRYVLRVDHEDKVLLHNVVTGCLAVLDREEAAALDNLPSAYSPVMEQLVTEHYLVPEDYDEHQQVINLRMILRKLEAANHTTDIAHFIILLTTACNARCYYCYQQDIPIASMSEQTADQVVDFICNHCGDRKQVTITWFGGEPTLSADRIDQISGGLRKNGIEFRSLMISNGYLFNEDLVKRARSSWNLQQITITIDGTEKTYNRTKAYVNPCDSPYLRVMQNIGLLLDSGIAVQIRMNYDKDNWREYAQLVEEVKDRFPDTKRLTMTAHRILGGYSCVEDDLRHGDLAWFEDKKVELDKLTKEAGLCKGAYGLPHTRYEACGAANDKTAVIMPDGNLVSCPDQLEKDQVKGNIRDGVTNTGLASMWKQFAEYPKCAECSFMPACVHMLCCRAKDNCASKKDYLFWSTIEIRNRYNAFIAKN